MTRAKLSRTLGSLSMSTPYTPLQADGGGVSDLLALRMKPKNTLRPSRPADEDGMAQLAKLETLMGAFDALTRAGEFETSADPRNWVRCFNRLLDAAIDCGMDRDHEDVSGWTAIRITRALVSA